MEDSTVDVTCNNDTDGKILLTVTTQPSGSAYGIDWVIDNFIGSVPDDLDGLSDSLVAVSYTHLTLPTKRIV